MKFKLYHYWRSTSSWRVRWAFRLKEIDCEFVALNLLSDDTDQPDYLSKNPLGFVPTLEFIEVGKPSRFLAESVAIIEWAEELRPMPRLLPGDAYHRGQVRQLVQLINASIQPLQNLNTQDMVSEITGGNKEARALWTRHWIDRGLNAYEKLVKSTARKFSVGDQITMADLFLTPQCYNALRNDMDLKKYPTVQKIFDATKDTRGYKESEPDMFKPV